MLLGREVFVCLQRKAALSPYSGLASCCMSAFSLGLRAVSHLAAGGCKVDEREGGAGEHHVAQPGVRRPEAGVEPAQSARSVCAQAAPQNAQCRPQLPHVQHQVHQRLPPTNHLLSAFLLFWSLTAGQTSRPPLITASPSGCNQPYKVE